MLTPTAPKPSSPCGLYCKIPERQPGDAPYSHLFEFIAKYLLPSWRFLRSKAFDLLFFANF
jgi:hypothetical protein